VDWDFERGTVQYCRYCKRVRFFDHNFQGLSIQLFSRIPKVAAE
jgi:L-lysine 2,3-aminomutase